MDIDKTKRTQMNKALLRTPEGTFLFQYLPEKKVETKKNKENKSKQ